MASRLNFSGFSGGIPLTLPRSLRLSLIARLPHPGLQADLAQPTVQGRGQADTVDQLLAEHADAVYRYALRLTRHSHAAQDLMQETLLRGWRARRSLREPAAARVWLLRIATNLHRDGWRANRALEPIVADPIDRTASAVGRLEHKECVERALAALDELPSRQRQAMHLITIEQLTHQQAAEVLAISVDALKASLSLARREMRERLKDIFDDLHGVQAESR
jgi:RNA polymerase sigma-70 factor (ECF subfamily)